VFAYWCKFYLGGSCFVIGVYSQLKRQGSSGGLTFKAYLTALLAQSSLMNWGSGLFGGSGSHLGARSWPGAYFSSGLSLSLLSLVSS
jgi:hypothetical protein